MIFKGRTGSSKETYASFVINDKAAVIQRHHQFILRICLLLYISLSLIYAYDMKEKKHLHGLHMSNLNLL